MPFDQIVQRTSLIPINIDGERRGRERITRFDLIFNCLLSEAQHVLHGERLDRRVDVLMASLAFRFVFLP